jgi:hypothetical protein
MSIGRMLGALTLLTDVTLDMGEWKCLSDRSMKLMSESIFNLKSLNHLDLNFQ